MPDSSESMSDASCLCCGHPATPKVSLIDRPEVYVCERCHRRATLQMPESGLATEEEGDAYMHGWFDGSEAPRAAGEPTGFRSVGKADFHMSAEMDVVIGTELFIRTDGVAADDPPGCEGCNCAACELRRKHEAAHGVAPTGTGGIKGIAK